MTENSLERVAYFLEVLVRERFQVSESDARFHRDTNLWEGGYVDSIGVVEMIGGLEEEFKIRIPEETLFDPDFTNINGIARLLTHLIVK